MVGRGSRGIEVGERGKVGRDGGMLGTKSVVRDVVKGK